MNCPLTSLEIGTTVVWGTKGLKRGLTRAGQRGPLNGRCIEWVLLNTS